MTSVDRDLADVRPRISRADIVLSPLGVEWLGLEVPRRGSQPAPTVR